jgi:EthD domain
MLKVFGFLTKRKDLETEAFIDYYENHHVPLVLSLAPSRWSSPTTPAPDSSRRAQSRLASRTRYFPGRAQWPRSSETSRSPRVGHEPRPRDDVVWRD